MSLKENHQNVLYHTTFIDFKMHVPSNSGAAQGGSQINIQTATKSWKQSKCLRPSPTSTFLCITTTTFWIYPSWHKKAPIAVAAALLYAHDVTAQSHHRHHNRTVSCCHKRPSNSTHRALLLCQSESLLQNRSKLVAMLPQDYAMAGELAQGVFLGREGGNMAVQEEGRRWGAGEGGSWWQTWMSDPIPKIWPMCVLLNFPWLLSCPMGLLGSTPRKKRPTG